MNAIISDNFDLTNTSFSFFGDISDILIKDLNSKMDGLIIKDGNLQIKNDKILRNSQISFFLEKRCLLAPIDLQNQKYDL